MEAPSFSVLDVVALLTDVPQHGLVRGQVGTIVEILSSDVFEVEFSDDEGRPYAELAVPPPPCLRSTTGPSEPRERYAIALSSYSSMTESERCSRCLRSASSRTAS